jgi:hypothetical protein
LFVIIAAVYEFNPSSIAEASPADKPAGLESDYCSPELRAKVEELKASVADERTTAKNSAERLPVLWEWANVRAAAGYRIPANLPLLVHWDHALRYVGEQIRQNKDLSFFERFKRSQMNGFNHSFVLSLTDRFVKEIQLREEDPNMFGSVSGEPMEFPAHTFQTIEQTFTVGTRDLEPGAYMMVAQNFTSMQGKYQTDDPEADNYVSVRCSNASAKFEATTKRKFGMHGGFRFPAPNIAFELVKGHLTNGDTNCRCISPSAMKTEGFPTLSWT